MRFNGISIKTKGGSMMHYRHTKKDFARFYRTYLEEKVHEIETSRQHSMEKMKQYKERTTFLLIAYALLVPLVIIMTGLFSFQIAFMGALAIFALSYWFPYQQQKKLILHNVKNDLIAQIVPFLDPSFRYEPNSYIAEDVFLRANFCKTDDIDSYRGDDYIYGKVGETSVEFSELQVIREDGDDEQTTLFKGLFFVVDFHKSFQGTVYAVPKKERFFTFHKGIKKTNNRHETLQDVQLENPLFQQKYLVRASDQTLARYVFTPSFMEKILQFQEQMGIEVLLSFQDGNMYLGLKTNKDHFDLSLHQIINEEMLYDYFKDVKIAFDIVEEFNLNACIWG